MKISLKLSLAKDAIIDYVDNISENNWIMKTLVVLIVWLVATIPIDIYFFLHWVLKPDGFWQKFFLLVFWGAVFGWFQILAFIFAAGITFAAITNENP